MTSGIKILHEPPERDAGTVDAMVDIVAIHGIGAPPDDTWTYKRSGERTNWLVDASMLPKAVPNARIMRTNVSDVAEMLLTELHFHRRDAAWPIIFIAHSYGGLVLLQALRRSFDNPEKWSNPFRYTTGLAFFGTPFRGRAGLTLEEIVNTVATNNKDATIYRETMALSVEENPRLKDIVS
ncbi:hypothetical protein JX266_013920 [Neoarthrinium moseri]|nr:hypothetical protein JX266_013920 [Neoarthrinium moseri]